MEKFKLFTRKFSEAWTACMLVMVQGDLSVLSMNHTIVASKTGLFTGLAIVLTSYFKKIDNKYMIAWLTGLFTTLSDYLAHPSMIKGESIITGIGAGLLALILSFILEKKN